MTSNARRIVAFVLGVSAMVVMSGFLLVAAPPQEVGTWGVTGTTHPLAARSGAATATLADGSTFIAGGRLGDGTVTDSVVVYDPLSNASTTVGHLLSPRVNAAAARLDDGRVLVVGGEVGELLTADVEIFDPATGTSTIAGAMAQPRTQHAAARLADGRVLIVGGETVDHVALASTEVFDPETFGMLEAGSMAVARVGATATLLIDNRVLVVGGNSGPGTPDLASAELYHPFSNEFVPVDTQLSVARSGHTATLLPHNGAVLVAGGTAAGVPVTDVDLFLPAMFPDPYSWGMGTFAPGTPLGSPRSNAVSGPAGDDGYAFVAGGGMPTGEAYAFATIKTDKDDYAPGQFAVITGSGWEPGEAVKLVFQEDPAVHDDYVIDRDTDGNPLIVADGEGNFIFDQWAPEWHDLGVRFYMMAIGDVSGRRAQVTFTDNITVDIDSKNPNASSRPWFRTVAGGFNVTITGDFVCNTGNGTGGRCFSATSVSVGLLPDGSSTEFASKNATLNSPAAGDWTVTFEFRTSPGSGQFAIPADGLKDVTATFTAVPCTNATCTAGSGSTTASLISDKHFGVDNTPPAIAIDTPLDNLGPDFDVTGTASDAASGLKDNKVNVKLYKVVGGSLSDPTDLGDRPVSSGAWVKNNYTRPSDPGTYCFVASAEDVVGNTASTTTAATGAHCFTVASSDTTAPTTTIALTPSAPNGSNGWHVTDVSVTVSAVDAGGTGVAETRCVLDPVSAPATFDDIPSGCDYTSAGAAVTTDGIHTIYAASRDSATPINKETPVKSASFKIDKTAPGISLQSRTPTANGNGWNNGDVTVVFACTDATSGAVSATDSHTVNTEGAGQSVTGTCTDNAGNTNTLDESDIKIDKTAPGISLQSRTPAANGNGWNNGDVTVVFACTDATSGAVSATDSHTVNTEGADQSVTGTCTDNAGNTNTLDESGINIDKTAPTNVSGAPNRSPDHNGWYNHAVDVVFTGTDALSGIASCTTANYSGPDGNDVAVNGSCTDKAGNSSGDVASSAFDYDSTAPTISASLSPSPAPSGWYNIATGAPTVSFTCSDALSGLDGACPSPHAFGEGADQSKSETIYDVAGNSATAGVSDVDVDLTAPSIVATLSPASPAASGWYNIATGAPTVSFTCSDALSGPAGSCPTTSTFGEGANQSRSETIYDVAGNSATAGVSNIDVDLTVPSVSITSPANGSNHVLNAAVSSDYVCSDGTSGVAICAGPVADGANFDTASVGSKSFVVNATDNAGNSNSASAFYSVQYASGGLCLGSPGHTILQPINPDGYSVFKQKSTVPAKFRVCDANGVSIGTPGVVSNFKLYQVINGTVTDTVNEPVDSTAADSNFRWSATDQQWIFNINTKGLSAGKTHVFLITLNDGGSPIEFRFGLK